MSEVVDIVVIKGDWKGGHHSEYPKVFGIGKDSSRPFCVSEGWGWGSAGGCFSLYELFERKIAEVFNTPDTKGLYEALEKARVENRNSFELAKELLEKYKCITSDCGLKSTKN